MRKIIYYNLVSLDGFFAGPKGEIDWHRVDEEFNQYAIEFLNSVDTIIFGRITYQLFENFWPVAAKDPATSKSDRVIANQINDLNKVVFSKTLTQVSWQNSHLIRQVVPDEIVKMKGQPGKDMVIFGSANLAQSFIKPGLVDEYRIMVNPIVLGNGMPLFQNLQNRIELSFIRSHTFKTGVIVLTYQPDFPR